MEIQQRSAQDRLWFQRLFSLVVLCLNSWCEFYFLAYDEKVKGFEMLEEIKEFISPIVSSYKAMVLKQNRIL